MFKVINTPCGVVKGKVEDGIAAFKGIRYATAKRWCYPEIVTSWENEYDATEYGYSCYQKKAFFDESDKFYFKEFHSKANYKYNEDCLFLNVFVKEEAIGNKKLPVIVYIHGGSFVSGSSNEPEFDQPVWPNNDVVAVTINYRLGLLGFACLKEAEEEAGHTGNYGLADQITALEWVKANIEAFGGDPENITIMGQSAGAMSVQDLVLSPLTEGLVHKAVMVSGGGNSRIMGFPSPKSTMKKFAKLYEATGCQTLEELRNFDVEELHKIFYELKLGFITRPSMDGRILVESPFDTIKKGRLKNIPYLIGSTSEDIMSGFLYDMGRKWCLEQEKQNLSPSYLWMFDRYLPGDDNGAWHAADLWYWFGTFHKSWRPFEEKDRLLKDTMITYLTNFAKTGNPNEEGLPTWTPCVKKNQNTMFFGEGDIRMDKVNKGALYKFMLTKRPVGF